MTAGNVAWEESDVTVAVAITSMFHVRLPFVWVSRTAIDGGVMILAAETERLP